MGWYLIRSGHSTRSTIFPPIQVPIPSEIIPIELMSSIYMLWSDIHSHEDPIDHLLMWGKEWIDYQKDLKLLIPKAPTVCVDREFFRFCLSFIEKRHDWLDEDYEITISHLPGQLQIIAKDIVLHCPAVGYLVDKSIVSARQLFRGIPKRFSRNSICLQEEGGKLIIGGYQIDLRREEDNIVSDYP
ncbi:MAG: hypothetical protein ABI144_07895 [Gallionella sp.]